MTTFRQFHLSSLAQDLASIASLARTTGEWWQKLNFPILFPVLLLALPMHAQGTQGASGRGGQQQAPEAKPVTAPSFRLEGSSPKISPPNTNHLSGALGKPVDQHPHADHRREERSTTCDGPLLQPMSAEQAMFVAESETGGTSVSVRQIDLNAASGGYEVMVRMPGNGKAYRVIIDIDTRKVRSTYPIPNSQQMYNNRRDGSDNQPSRWLPAIPEAERNLQTSSASGATPVSSLRGSTEMHLWRDSNGILNITSFPPDGYKEIK